MLALWTAFVLEIVGVLASLSLSYQTLIAVLLLKT